MALRANREETEASHWWFVGRRAVISALAADLPPGPRLEVGCGYHGALSTGHTDPSLKVGLDLEEEKLSSLREKHGACAVSGGAEQLPFTDASFSCVMLLDVLEHVRDDWLALAQACRVLQPGGRALVTVPAFPSLWSPHDAAEMHIRRYRRAQLLRLCESAGFHVTKSGHFNILLFLPAVTWRILSRRLYRHRMPRDDFYMLPRPINNFLAALFALERHLAPYLPFPFGLSIFAVLEKPDYTGSTAPAGVVAKQKGGT